MKATDKRKKLKEYFDAIEDSQIKTILAEVIATEKQGNSKAENLRLIKKIIINSENENK